MITAMFLMLFSLSMYIEWGIKDDERAKRKQRAEQILVINSKREYLLEKENLSNSICS